MKINKLLESKKLRESTEVLFQRGNKKIIKDGYGYAIDDGINANRFYVNDKGEPKFDDGCPSKFWLNKVNSLIKSGKITSRKNESTLPRNASKIRATHRYGDKKSMEMSKDGKYWRHGGEMGTLYDPSFLRRSFDIEVLETDPNYKPNRTKPEYVVQGNYGYGWEDLTASDNQAEARNDLKAYRENETGVPHRLITRRVPVTENLKEAFKPSDSGIQSVKCYNRYNYTIQELRVDNDNKTFERGNFTAGKADKKVKNRQDYEDIVDTLKELGYTEIKSDYRSMRNKSRKGVLQEADNGKVSASKWYASQYPDDEVGIEQLDGLYLDDILKDRNLVGHCDTQVRERVYAQLDRYSPRILDVQEPDDGKKWQYSIGGKDVPYTSYEDAKAHMKDDYKITDYRDELQKYIDKETGRPHTFFVDETFDDRLVISINWGDWKHEHGYADYLVKKFFMDKGLGIEVEREITDEDGSDTYSADHYYDINDISFSGRVIDESKESEESELITQYINNGEFDKLEKVKNGTNVIWKLKESIDEGYGGAFDIADDQYFTREDIENAAEEVMNHIEETFTEPYHLGGTWFENGQWIVNVQGEQFDEYEISLPVDMRKIKEPWHLKRAYASEMASKLIGQIKEYNNINEDTSISSRYEFDDDVDDLSYYYSEEDIIDALNDVWEEKASKSVSDSNGFMTDYTMYRNINTGEYVFVFGDKDIYRPEDGYFDWECETEEEAEEWFNNYNGFDEDEFEGFEESYETDKVFSAACNNRMDYMKRGFAKGKIDPNVRFNRFNSDHSYIMGALRNGNKDMVKYLQDQGGTILDSEQDEYNWLMNEEVEDESPILHKKSDGSYLVAANDDGYTAFNKSDVYMGHITATNEQEAKNKFNANQFDENLNK